MSSILDYVKQFENQEEDKQLSKELKEFNQQFKQQIISQVQNQNTTNQVEKQIKECYQALMQKYVCNERMEEEKEKAYEIMTQLTCIRINGINYFKCVQTNKWINFVNFETIRNAISNTYKSIKMSELNKITNWIKIIYDEVSFEFAIEERYMLFENGYIDLSAAETKLTQWENKDILNLLPIDYIQYEYNELNRFEVENELMRQFINWSAKGNEIEYNIIMTMLGIVASNMRVEYFFNLYGVSGSGKSTLLDLAKQLVGHKYCVDKPIAKLNERFQLIPLINKKLFYNGDASNDEIDPSVLKLLTTTGHIWDIEVKGENTQLAIKLPLNVIINSNHILNFKDFVGIDRRIIPIHFPFKQNFVGKNFKALEENDFRMIKPQLANSFDFTQKAVESIIPDIVEALKNFYQCGKKFKQMSSYGENAMKKIEKSNNNIIQFIEEYDLENNYKTWLETKQYYYIKTQELFKKYQEITIENNGRPKGKNNFVNDIEEYCRVRGVDIKTNHLIYGVGKGFISIPKNAIFSKQQKDSK